MKKYIILFLCLCSFTTNVHAFELTQIKPESSYIEKIGADVEADKAYIRGVAESYKNRFVVTEEQYLDISSIDDFYVKLSTPLSLTEIDNGKAELDTSRIGSKDYQKQMNFFKICGGLAGYCAEFEPIAYFSIYRNISLVGGYVQYHKAFENADDAYWQYICSLETLTKEVIPYETRLILLDKVRNLSAFMDSDRSFKIFILKDGKIDSMWERDDGA